jgi:hypothetical protein
LRRMCLLKQVNEGKIEVTGRRWRRSKQLLDNVKEKREYWKLKGRSTRSHAVKKSIWKRLWSRGKTN